MDLMHLVDRLEELVASAQKMPIGNRAIIDRRRLLDLVDQMRIAIPEEVREAQAMVLRREEVRREAEEEARIIVARSEEQAARLVEAHEITEGARHRAEELAQQAEVRLEERIREANEDIQSRIDQSRALARQQMDAADDYARELLTRLHRQLEAFVRSVESGIHQLEPDRDEAPPQTQEAVGVAQAQGARTEAPRDAGFATAGTTNGGSHAVEDYGDDIDDEGPEPTDAPRDWREPVPLRQRSERAADEEGELENLLRRRPAAREEVEVEREPGVIDDFANPPLDDDPTQYEDDLPPDA